MSLVEARPLKPSDTPTNNRECGCGQTFLAVAVHSDGTVAAYFCPTCDTPDFKKKVTSG